ncbi:DNA gyrase inhibitor YacG [Methylotenera versatilis]|uniref:DNA gyrase inhibitor YacG n=1 Tax=Methylotenera versatilis TaxID=1055487 RepID=UPI0009DDF72F|nr:DNA gyrase inhibitor YacG [Methylotenera versatilis]
MSDVKPRLVACPHCKKLIEYSLNNKFRPFCSERCQMIDLGDWANENYKIPDNSPPSPEDELN